MASDVFVQMSGDEANLLKAIRAVGQGAEKEIAGGFKKGQREARELERIAQKGLRSIETGQDRVNREVKEYKRALDGGKLSQQQYNRIVKQTQKAHADTGRVAGAQLASTIAQYASVAGAIQTVLGLLQQEQQMRDAAARRVVEGRRGLGELAQLAIDEDPEKRKAKFRQLTTRAEELLAAGGATDINQAARSVFSLESAGILDDFAIFRDLAKSGTVSDIETLGRSVATLTTAIGKGETGTAAEVISKGFAASAFTPATVPELLEATAQSGGLARQLKLGDEGLLTATAALAKATGSAGQGGTQVNALLTALAKAPVEIEKAKQQVAEAAQKGEDVDATTAAIAKLPDDFRGRGLQETARIVQQTIGTEGQAFFKLFGRKEAQSAIFNLTGGEGAELFPQIQSAIERANERGGEIARQQAALPLEASPQLAAAQRAESAQKSLQIAEETAFSEMRNLRQELVTALRSQSLDEGGLGTVRRFGLNLTDTFRGLGFGSDELDIEGLIPELSSRREQQGFQTRFDDLLQRQEQLIQLQIEQNELTRRANARPPASTRER